VSPACELGLALMAACAIVPPDGKPPVTVTRACVRQFSAEERTAAIACAAENGVPWRFVRGQKQKSEGQ
jgi:hypothetical protein